MLTHADIVRVSAFVLATDARNLTLAGVDANGLFAAPGGKREKNDPSLWATALREAAEEIGPDVHLRLASPIVLALLTRPRGGGVVECPRGGQEVELKIYFRCTAHGTPRQARTRPELRKPAFRDINLLDIGERKLRPSFDEAIKRFNRAKPSLWPALRPPGEPLEPDTKALALRMRALRVPPRLIASLTVNRPSAAA